jgi:radical SAM-linked protein
MQRALKRTHFDVWYTQGFNPHMYITFPMPISLGFESYAECMDLKLNESVPFDTIKDTLNSVLPEGIIVTDVKNPVMKPEKIAKIEYGVIISSNNLTSEQLNKAFEEFLSKETILVEKKTKKGVSEIDIKPHVKLMSTSPLNDGKIKIRAYFTAGIMFNVNPTLLIYAFSDFLNDELEVHSVVKKRVLTDENEDFK